MLFDASKKFSIDLSRSFMIGDRDVDVETGRNAGCRTLRLRSAQDQSPGLVAADLESDNWEELARYVLDSVPSDET
jgi:D-glycero-D-manno-heptose 1,7-bisphosphate phosphatase